MIVRAIDHLVVAAGNLDEGVDYIVETLGVTPRCGGEHKTMGTHNRVVRLGADCYLEVIAANGNAPKPARPRWFELDLDAMREKLRLKPRLITWAVRTDRIETLAGASAYPLGKVEWMSRGDLSWRLTLTEDGHLPGCGLVPFLIQWDADPHIASLMPESGCRLVRLEGFHPEPESIVSVLQSLGVERFLDMERTEARFSPFLTAVIDTPSGIRILG